MSCLDPLPAYQRVSSLVFFRFHLMISAISDASIMSMYQSYVDSVTDPDEYVYPFDAFLSSIFQSDSPRSSAYAFGLSDAEYQLLDAWFHSSSDA